jgi:hypothetical protein
MALTAQRNPVSWIVFAITPSTGKIGAIRSDEAHHIGEAAPYFGTLRRGLASTCFIMLTSNCAGLSDQSRKFLF